MLRQIPVNCKIRPNPPPGLGGQTRITTLIFLFLEIRTNPKRAIVDLIDFHLGKKFLVPVEISTLVEYSTNVQKLTKNAEKQDIFKSRKLNSSVIWELFLFKSFQCPISLPWGKLMFLNIFLTLFRGFIHLNTSTSSFEES